MSYSPGAGSSRIATSSDVAISALTDKDVLQYSGSNSKWTNHALAESDIANLTTDLASRVQTKNGGLETVVTVASSGASYGVNAANGNLFALTLTANCTFSLSGATAGKSCAITLLLQQDGTGSRTVTWPGSVRWSGGVAPTLTTTASKVDFIGLLSVDGGTNWFGFISGTNY